MKMQTVVAAAALALALSARADQWFDAGIANIDDWPDTAGWTNTGNTTYTNETISLEGASGLTYTASPTKTLGSSEAVTVTTTMKLTAYDADDLPDVPEDAKAAIIAVNDDSVLSYKGLAKVESANGWVALSGATPTEDASVDISISLLDGKVRYKVGDAVLTSGNAEWLDVVASGTVSNVVYKGTGDISALSGTTEPPTATVVLDWPAGYTAMSYQVGEGTPVSITGTSPVAVSDLPIGTVVTFVVQNADGAQKTLTGTAGTDSKIDAAEATFTWADYLGEADNGAYTIDDANDLDMLRKGVDAGIATTGETFKLTADIALDAPWPGIGVQNGKDIYSTDNFNAAAFCGTFDGQNHTISGFQMVGGGLDYCGFFNSIYGATIQNLKIQYAGSLFAADTTQNSSLESGATFVGVAKSSTLRNLTTLSGTVSCDKGFGGIVGYLTSGTLVDSCTNNVNMTSLKPNKCGGIAMITQGGSAVTIRNCQNNGTIAGSNETGSLVGYIGLDTTIEDCDSTVAYKLFHHQGSTVTVSGITADASVASYSGAATPGLNFATVDNGVATFVADDALALNGSYKVMSGNATATFVFTAPGTISFDESLATPTYAITSSGAAGNPTSAKEGNVTTYTAGYFPRTATAGQDGSAEHPFEIADEDDLLALQAAVDANVGRDRCYVQTADIALTAAWGGIGVKGGKDIVSQAAYDDGAFTGVYDGGNYTISNFLMENGTDYGALFNSIYNATIKNLKLSWGSSTLCANSSASGGDTGASFVGVAKASTLQNLTTVAGAVTTVSASKDFGGIVGYLMAGSTVESCTNALNVASLKNTGRKCGGIAIITQSGSGTAVIRNCKNSGTVTAANKGGILGYVGVATEIDGCENTAAVQLFHFQDGSVTASGVNKGNATVASNDKSGGVSGLYFATVDGDVATFVADNALALNGSYKVMSAGATATFAFAEAGTIAFDTNLTQNVTFAITAPGLNLSEETANGVVTYTAAALGYNGGGDSTFTIPANREAALEGNLPTGKTLADKVSATSDLTYAQAYALGLWSENSAEVADLGATITVGADGKVSVSLATEPTTGYLVTCKVYEKASLTAEWPTEPKATYAYGSEQEFTPASSEAGFYKVEVVITNAQ